MKYNFLEPIKIGKMELKNRIILPAMARFLCEDGFVTEPYIEYFRTMAKGGSALIITGIMPVDPIWPNTSLLQPCLSDDKYMPGLKDVVDAVHAEGAKIAFQPWMPGRDPFLPKDVPAKVKEIAIVNRLTKDEIKNIQRKYVNAAIRCQKAGVDAIEFHIAHNFLAEQFYSPFFNLRQDEYGAQLLKIQCVFP